MRLRGPEAKFRTFAQNDPFSSHHKKIGIDQRLQKFA